MRRRINISEARGKLPELARFLSRHPDAVVLVEHRDLPERLALTTEGHLRYLEARVEELQKEASRPFRLAGSITSELSDEELEVRLQELRRKEAMLAERKLRELAS